MWKFTKPKKETKKNFTLVIYIYESTQGVTLTTIIRLGTPNDRSKVYNAGVRHKNYYKGYV